MTANHAGKFDETCGMFSSKIGRGGPFVERSVGGGAENVLGEEEGRMWDRRRDLRVKKNK